MTTTHDTVNWTAGDDWQIDATLYDENDQPFDLGGAPVIKWALMDNANRRALDEGDVIITITDAAAGKCMISIPAEKTKMLAGGRYNDVIRIIYGGIASTLSYGLIYVVADPWQLAEVGAQQAARLYRAA